MAAIELVHLSKVYGNDVTAVRDLNLDVAEGEFMVLVGPSGCGKTTALRMIAGLEEITSGEIRIGGKPVFSSSPSVNVPAERRELSMVFQSYAIWPHMTVFDNVAYGLRVRRRPDAEVTTRVREALDLVQLGELGASILLMGPNAKVMTPAIVESWFSTSSELTAAMAVLQTVAVAVALAILFAVARRATQHVGE